MFESNVCSLLFPWSSSCSLPCPGYPVRSSSIGAEGIGRTWPEARPGGAGRLAGRQDPRRGGGGGHDPVVGEGRGDHCLLQEAVEEQAAVGRGAAVEAEGELVQVPVEL